MTPNDNQLGRRTVSNHAFGFDNILGLAGPAALKALAKSFAAMEDNRSCGGNVLADVRWDSSSLIECRVIVASRKGFFPFSSALLEGEISTAGSVQ
jgi:hypothetical protein